MQPEPRLSPHFFLSEFTVSQAATRLALRNVPFSRDLEDLRRLALLLEDVRAALNGAPILISSGYRSMAVNRAVGGAPSSAHVYGRAADFTAPAFGTPRAICQRLLDRTIVFDQLIYERSWVHIAVSPISAEPRRETLTATFAPGQPTHYAKGLG